MNYNLNGCSFTQKLLNIEKQISNLGATKVEQQVFRKPTPALYGRSANLSHVHR